MPDEMLIAVAESSTRSRTGIVWDSHDGKETAFHPYSPDATERMLSTRATTAHSACPGTGTASQLRARHTRNAIYACDGTLEGMLTAVHAAFQGRDAQAEILVATQAQPRIGQDIVDVVTEIEDASKVRRLIEYALGAQAFRCIRAVASCDSPARGTAIYRFLRHALPASGRTECTHCAKKAGCTRACSRPASCDVLDDLAEPAVFNMMSLYREVVNERHHMLEFMRFEHCEGDVWFARCNPKANVVPLLMDWFIARFNDQKFVIYDENHAISGVYDGMRWYLVGGSDVTPPPHMEDERAMQEAWQRFYRNISIEARYHPELRRNFMPMRLWKNLPEMR